MSESKDHLTLGERLRVIRYSGVAIISSAVTLLCFAMAYHESLAVQPKAYFVAGAAATFIAIVLAAVTTIMLSYGTSDGVSKPKSGRVGSTPLHSPTSTSLEIDRCPSKRTF